MELGRGEEFIDVRVPNRELTELEFKEYNIRSNVSIGDWDIDILNDVLDIDLLSFGLNVEDIPIPILNCQWNFKTRKSQSLIQNRQRSQSVFWVMFTNALFAKETRTSCYLR
jgi:hypothetical protein